MLSLKIIGVSIFLEKRKTRLHVGYLRKKEEMFFFEYDDHYFRAEKVIPLGPEFPLTKKEFFSETLFPSFQDRIPSTQNPAYAEYCLAMGIDPQEKDPMILLSMIGRKGPSSFIYYPLFEKNITSHDIIKFRELLGLTTREFSSIFEFSQGTLVALESNRITGNEIMKRLEIILNFPQVAKFFLLVNGGHLIHEKLTKAIESLSENSKL